MSFLGDFLLGSKPDMQLPGYAQGFYDQLKGYLGDIGLGKPGHEYKSIIKKYNQDPASLATMSIARGGVNAREMGERNAQGANALIGAGSGEQANLLHHNMETDRAKLDENTAMNAIGESQQKYFGALGGLQDSINSRRSAEMGTLGMMGNTLGMGRDMRRSGGLFNPAAWGEQIRTGCWIAIGLYGDNDPRVDVLRQFIFGRWQTMTGRLFAAIYRRFGERIAAVMKRNRVVKAIMRGLFDRLLVKAKG